MPLDVANYFYDHPRGPVYGWFTRTGLGSLHLPHADRPEKRVPLLHSWKNDRRVRVLDDAFERYFAGMEEAFAGVPVDFSELSPFQQQVYAEARKIPWGVTMTYGDLCDRLGLDKTSARAVGRALGQNPLAIIVPCHRFLAANGNLTGFAAGLAWKEDLLRLEGAII